MKKYLALALAATLFFTAAPAARAADNDKSDHTGGIVGGIVGCCFGIRTAAAWNDGKDINVREWLQLVFGIGYIWAAIDGWSGVTTTELQKNEPAYF